MSELRTYILPRIAEAYSAYYDINLMEDDTSSLFARCDYHARNSQYVLIKKAEIWAAEHHEYLYLHTTETVNPDILADVMQQTLADGEPRVSPNKDHLSTHLSAVIVCDEVPPDLAPLIRRMKKHRDYRLSLHGWMEFRIAVVDLSTAQIFTNSSGKKLSKELGGFVEKEIKKFEKRRGET